MTRPILTTAQIRTAETRAADRLGGEAELMERAGAALAAAVKLFAGPRDTLILCGPGNNGGDGYVAARYLAEAGYPVRVAALADPKTAASASARGRWAGEVAQLSGCEGAPILIDCLFGTGLSRGLDQPLADLLRSLVDRALVAVACDLPSGVASDDGSILSPVGQYDLTVALGALKPAHRLHPSMGRMGRLVLAEIGLDLAGDWIEIGRPQFPVPDPGAHKYSRGLVHCLAGQMPGAIALAASAAARSGAGYVRVSTSLPIAGLPASIMQTGTADLQDKRIGCILVGPGLGDVPQLLTLALTAPRPIVIDADAIGLVGKPERLIGHDTILTPHEGEFVGLFGSMSGSKPDRALDAARRAGAVVVYKGPDTLVAAPDGRLGFAPPAPAWLASAGTGDVLAGMIASLRAQGLAPFEAACAGVWLHGRAAEFAGRSMTADTLVEAVGPALDLWR